GQQVVRDGPRRVRAGAHDAEGHARGGVVEDEPGDAALAVALPRERGVHCGARAVGDVGVAAVVILGSPTRRVVVRGRRGRGEGEGGEGGGERRAADMRGGGHAATVEPASNRAATGRKRRANGYGPRSSARPVAVRRTWGATAARAGSRGCR